MMLSRREERYLRPSKKKLLRRRRRRPKEDRLLLLVQPKPTGFSSDSLPGTRCCGAVVEGLCKRREELWRKLKLRHTEKEKVEVANWSRCLLSEHGAKASSKCLLSEHGAKARSRCLLREHGAKAGSRWLDHGAKIGMTERSQVERMLIGARAHRRGSSLL